MARRVSEKSCASSRGLRYPSSFWGEFRYGIAGSRHRSAYEEWLDIQLRHFDLLAITAETTIPYASLRGTLKRLGRPIPANDAWIAALAMQHRLPILSRDAHFDALPDLRRITW